MILLYMILLFLNMLLNNKIANVTILIVNLRKSKILTTYKMYKVYKV